MGYIVADSTTGEVKKDSEITYPFWRLFVPDKIINSMIQNVITPETMINIAPMEGPFGAILSGIDLSRPISNQDFLQIAAALRDHHILVIENQRLDKAAYLQFGKRWGEPITFFHPELRESEYPQLIVIHNRSDTPEEDRDVAMQWHCDGSYEDPPAAVTMLYAVEGPEIGNDTLFADMEAAYTALPDTLKQRIENRVVMHGVGDPRLNLPGENRGGAKDIPPVQTRPVVEYPFVMKHPQTGRNVLYAPSGSAFGIVGMATEEALALLREIKIHATQPQFVQRATARTGNVVIWDNFAVMHSATPTRYSDKDGERRLIYRISTRDILTL